jgi:hypothetical protein
VPYQFFSFTEVASTTLTRLDFHAIDQNGSILLDNVNVTPVYMRGDVNLDNHVNAADITSMMTALTNTNSYEMLKGLSDSDLSHIGDVNQDGKFSNADLQALLNDLRNGGGSISTVPEPASFVLAAVGFLSLLPCVRHRRRCLYDSRI